MKRLPIFVKDETAPLEAVVLGIAHDFGGTPSLEDAYDPKSKEHILAGTFPVEEAIVKEIEAFSKILEKYKVKVYRPGNIKNYNQIFSRDIAFVIDDKFVIPNILKDRAKEFEAISSLVDLIDENALVKMPKEARIEGGDVMPWDDCIFIGVSNDEDFQKYTCARTNYEGVAFLQKTFPKRTVVSFELNKSDTEPRDNALHLDCCFQPIGTNQAIIYPGGFKNEEDVQFLMDYFGEENVIKITRDEMFHMNSNLFSISPKVIVSEKKFTRLNEELRSRGFTVEEIPYAEISKMEGLLRCSTLPLRRTSEKKQITSSIMMIRPAAFRFNEQTAENNYYQKVLEGLTADEIQAQALNEFDTFVSVLRTNGIEVIVVNDTLEPNTPDSIFPNNWISFHQDGRVGLYPMCAENRRLERRTDILILLTEDHNFLINEVLDFSHYENENIFLEGTGSMLLDRVNKVVYAALSLRTDAKILNEFCEKFEYTAVTFISNQTVDKKRLAIYHTNVMMGLGEGFAVLCADTIDDSNERSNLIASLEASGRELIYISESQKHRFAGNMLQVTSETGVKHLVMSKSAHESLSPGQVKQIERYTQILSSSLDTIEACGGGSARCMMAEIFLPKKV